MQLRLYIKWPWQREDKQCTYSVTKILYTVTLKRRRQVNRLGNGGLIYSDLERKTTKEWSNQVVGDSAVGVTSEVSYTLTLAQGRQQVETIFQLCRDTATCVSDRYTPNWRSFSWGTCKTIQNSTSYKKYSSGTLCVNILLII